MNTRQRLIGIVAALAVSLAIVRASSGVAAAEPQPATTNLSRQPAGVEAGISIVKTVDKPSPKRAEGCPDPNNC